MKKTKSKSKEKKQKRQFSKGHVIFADGIVLLVYAGSFVLSWFGKEPVSDVALAIITVYGAFATGGYFVQNCVRDCSLNKLEAIKITQEDNIDEN